MGKEGVGRKGRDGEGRDRPTHFLLLPSPMAVVASDAIAEPSLFFDKLAFHAAREAD